MVEHQPSKLDTWVRFPSPAFFSAFYFYIMRCESNLWVILRSALYRLPPAPSAPSPALRNKFSILLWAILEISVKNMIWIPFGLKNQFSKRLLSVLLMIRAAFWTEKATNYNRFLCPILIEAAFWTEKTTSYSRFLCPILIETAFWTEKATNYSRFLCPYIYFKKLLDW